MKNLPAVLAAVSQSGYEAKEISPDANASDEAKSSRWAVAAHSGDCRHGGADGGRMDFRSGDDAVVSVVRFRLAGVVQVFCGAAILSWCVEPIESRQLQHGHAGGAGFHDGVWLQRLGFVGRCGWAPVFHGGRRDHFADQPRSLAGGAGERPCQRHSEIAFNPRAADCPKSVNRPPAIRPNGQPLN